jgi:AP-2 complex subunit mu-1
MNICKSYFKADLADPVLRQNYVLIYELLDEVMDFGVPQITEPEVLKQFIVEGGMDMETLSDVDKLSQLTMQATGANSWRPKPVTYKKNTIYIDVIEKVEIQFS